MLRIYVSGQTGKSRSAVANLKKVCEKEIPGQYEIEVIDVSKNPKVAIDNDLVALPTVIRTLPAPIRKFVGNWSDEKGDLVGFELIDEGKSVKAKRKKAT
jgi:circadian clock protein KaiB